VFEQADIRAIKTKNQQKDKPNQQKTFFMQKIYALAKKIEVA